MMVMTARRASARKVKGGREDFHRKSMAALQDANVPFLIDGADIVHILQSCADKLDWQYLIHRFGPDWRVLLSHLVLFGYIYPSERDKIPTAVVDDLIGRLRKEASAAGRDRVCRGTLLSRKQYLLDIEERGLHDARLDQRVHMDSDDIAHWTRAIAKGEKARRAAAP